jgi:hypothetical protein
MSGIVFFGTEDRTPVVDFYVDIVGASVWLEQPDCTILEYNSFRFGFCERETVDDCGILTFYYEDRAGVDEMYDSLGERARGPPETNEKYEVYQFFADDPDGRTAEFQTFLHPLPGE